MKIILLKEVQNLGHAGEIKEVAEGYARNFLIPKGLADVLSKHNLNVLEAQKRKHEKMLEKAKKDKVKLAKKITGQKFKIQAKADEKGSLYAKINAKAVAAELARQGFKIEDSEVKLPEAIKKTGEYEVELNLGGERVKIKVEVVNRR
jgi:large subunit ribosomal protein L9